MEKTNFKDKKNRVHFIVISEDSSKLGKEDNKLIIYEPFLIKKVEKLPSEIDFSLTIGLGIQLNQDDQVYMEVTDPEESVIARNNITELFKKIKGSAYGRTLMGIDLSGVVEQSGLHVIRMYINEELIGEQIFIIKKVGESDEH